MAILRKELQGKGSLINSRNDAGQLQSVCLGIYDGIAEAAADLSEEQTASFSPGSLMYCLANRNLYIKTQSGQWEVL